MSDLFTRLAHRARAAAGFGVYGEEEPDHWPADAQDTEGGPVVGEHDRAEGAATPVTPVLMAAAAVASDPPETAGPSVQVWTREPRLMPMPAVVPPTSLAPSSLSPAIEPTSPRVARVDPAAVPRAASMPPRRVERVDREREVLRDRVLLSAPLAPEREPAGPVGREPAAPPQRPIEVTVGRIEVRVRPPARAGADPDRRPIPAPAALTLEEYLRRREVSS